LTCADDLHPDGSKPAKAIHQEKPMSVRKALAVLTVTCASLLAIPVAANAQSTPTPVPVSSFHAVPVTGTASNGKALRNGHFSVDRFVTRSNRTFAVGTLTGRIGHRFVRRSNVAIPVTVDGGLATTSAACQILHLVLGPVNLNLLGLHVHLNRVVLDITAQSGPGNLLGNLLCSVANLLNGNSLLQQQVTGLLNVLNGILGTPGILNL
jgi:hypothetical protein